ncbi:MAG TPA: magnesium transporter CorA family protein [Nitrososphaera sp.]|jgi:magnesium transporter
MLQEVANNGFRWINVVRPTKVEMNALGQEFHFHELNLDDCLSKIQIPKIDRYEDHVFIILHFPTVGQDKFPKSAQLAAFIGHNYIVTVHQGELRPLVDLFEQCKQSDKARQEFMGRSAGHLFYSMVDILTDELLNIVRKIVGNIEDIEEIVFDEQADAANEISYIRREVTLLRRIVIPLRRTLAEVTTRDIKRFSDQDLTLYFDDVNDHMDKVIETIDESKETIEIYKDTDFMHATGRSNKILAMLTIIFTLSMPVTIMSALYGMNVNLPVLSEEGDQAFLGQYGTFVVIVAGSTAAAGVMLAYFHKVGWI